MTKNTTEILVARCLRTIEENLGWGPSEDWTTYDFSKLSDEVHNRTHVRLSITTLKRIWGKLKYDSAPTLTTLNALSQFAGYSDWRSFCNQEGSPDSVEVLHNANNEASKSVPRKLNRYWLLLIPFPILVIGYFLILSGQKPRINPENYKFRADKMVTEGVPNSVVFHYDATAANDSVFIVQTWDIRRKKLVSKFNQEHSAIYYYPGFFRTKLIADGEIVKTHDLWITSDGWLCLQEDEPVPLYFRKDRVYQGGPDRN